MHKRCSVKSAVAQVRHHRKWNSTHSYLRIHYSTITCYNLIPFVYYVVCLATGLQPLSSQFFTQRDLVLPLSISSNSSFLCCHLLAACIFFILFPSLPSFLLSYYKQKVIPQPLLSPNIAVEVGAANSIVIFWSSQKLFYRISYVSQKQT